MMWDEKANGRSKKCQKGFTLVELIVVLVILGILAAIMVPVLTGWINKAKNQDAILECRSVVMAAQGQAAEEYANNPKGSMNEIMNREVTVTAILKTAATDGAISVNTIKLDESTTVTGLIYTTARGIAVIYDKAHQPVYRIENDADSKPDSAPFYKNKLEDLMKKEGLLGEDGAITEELKTTVEDNTIGRALQDYFIDKLGVFPPVTKAEAADIAAKLEKAAGNRLTDTALGSFQSNLTNAVWKPIVITERQGDQVIKKTMMVADIGNTSVDKADKGAARNACVIYYNYNYYVKMNYNGNGVNTAYVSDQGPNSDNPFIGENLHDSIVNDGWSKVG